MWRRHGRGVAAVAALAASGCRSSLECGSGTGGEPAGCTWPSVVATSLPGAYVVQELSASCP